MDDVKPLAAVGDDAEKAAILKACAEHPNSRAIAAALDISRATLYRRLKKHGIKRGVRNV
mgnify:CR=1 FL=1